MAEDTSVKFYNFTMNKAKPLIGNVTNRVREILTECLVTGFGETPILSAVVTNNVCRIGFANGQTFSMYATVLITDSPTTALNGEYKVKASASTWIEITYTAPNGVVNIGGGKIKYAPAGWEQPFAPNTTTSVFRSKNTDPDNPRHYLQVIETNNQSVRVRGYKTMTDLTNGTDEYPNIFNRPNGLFWPKSSFNNATIRTWVLISNGKFIYWISHPYHENMPNNPHIVALFGVFNKRITRDENNSIIRGALTEAESNNMTNISQGFGVSVCDPGDYLQIAGGITSKNGGTLNGDIYARVMPFSNGSHNFSTCSGSTYLPTYDQETGGIRFVDFRIGDVFGNDRGILPGAKFIEGRIDSTTYFYIEKGSGDFVGRDFLMLCVEGSSNTTAITRNIASSQNAVVAFDITGPW